jgi:hypothetical protein
MVTKNGNQHLWIKDLKTEVETRNCGVSMECRGLRIEDWVLRPVRMMQEVRAQWQKESWQRCGSNRALIIKWRGPGPSEILEPQTAGGKTMEWHNVVRLITTNRNKTVMLHLEGTLQDLWHHWEGQNHYSNSGLQFNKGTMQRATN